MGRVTAMTTIRTRVRQIAQVEDFDIVVTEEGKPVNESQNGILGPYPFTKKLAGNKTVAEWRSRRFERIYPGYSCIVYDADGWTADDSTLLSAVRKTFEDGE
jgi:hypothetical protein